MPAHCGQWKDGGEDKSGTIKGGELLRNAGESCLAAPGDAKSSLFAPFPVLSSAPAAMVYVLCVPRGLGESSAWAGCRIGRMLPHGPAELRAW